MAATVRATHDLTGRGFAVAQGRLLRTTVYVVSSTSKNALIVITSFSA